MSVKAVVRRAETAEVIHKADHPGYEFNKKVIVGKADSPNFELSVYEVPPGKSAVPYHYHLRNEEVFFIMSGTGLLRTPEGEQTVSAGDFLYFPSNESGAHKLTNISETEPLVYADFDLLHDLEVVFYPDWTKRASSAWATACYSRFPNRWATMKENDMRNESANTMLKGISILFIIFGAIVTLILVLGLIGSAAEISAYGGLPGIIAFTWILMIVVSVSGLVLGIIGLKKCNEPAKGGLFVAAGIILGMLSLVSIILSIWYVGIDFVIMGIPTAALIFISLVFSVLYVIGGSKYKKIR